MFGLHVCLCTTCIPGASGGQKRGSDPSELDLEKVVSLHVLEAKAHLLQEQPVFLTAEWSLQSSLSLSPSFKDSCHVVPTILEPDM